MLNRQVRIFGAVSLCALMTLVYAGCEKKDAKVADKPAAVSEKPAAPAVTYLDATHAPTGEGWTPLTNGKDLSGWGYFPSDRPNSWKVVNEVLTNAPEAGQKGVNIYTDKDYGDFEFYCEYKLAPGSNGGIFLRGIYEMQIVDDIDVPAGAEPKDWGNGGFWGKKPPDKNVSKPAGEWQSVYTKMVGKTATLVLNGQTVHKDYELPGATFLYPDLGERLKEGQPGPFILQGDHGPIEFRHLMVRSLK